MKIKLVAVVLLGTGLISFGLIRTASTVQKQQPPYKERLKWYAKEAKSGDRKKVTIPADVVEYLGSAGTITVEEAFSSSSVVIAGLAARESYPRNDYIVTWNKFIIEEVLSEPKKLPCRNCGPSDPPSSFLPLQPGEFLTLNRGGRVTIRDRDRTNRRRFPQYESGQTYLLLLVLQPSGTAWTIGGPVGVFRIINNDQLVPVRETEHKIHKDLKEKYGNSLESVRKHLKTK
jgi:hypothetical protein